MAKDRTHSKPKNAKKETELLDICPSCGLDLNANKVPYLAGSRRWIGLFTCPSCNYHGHRVQVTKEGYPKMKFGAKAHLAPQELTTNISIVWFVLAALFLVLAVATLADPIRLIAIAAIFGVFLWYSFTRSGNRV